MRGNHEIHGQNDLGEENLREMIGKNPTLRIILENMGKPLDKPPHKCYNNQANRTGKREKAVNRR